MSNSIEKIVAKSGLSEQEQEVLLLLSEHIQEGGITPQIPMYNLLSPTGVNALFLDQEKLKQLFQEGIVVWKTNAGLVNNSECRSPKSNRKISGVLYMSPSYMKKHIELFFEMANEAMLIENKDPYERSYFDSVLTNVAGKEYDFADILSVKKNKTNNVKIN